MPRKWGEMGCCIRKIRRRGSKEQFAFVQRWKGGHFVGQKKWGIREGDAGLIRRGSCLCFIVIRCGLKQGGDGDNTAGQKMGRAFGSTVDLMFRHAYIVIHVEVYPYSVPPRCSL